MTTKYVSRHCQISCGEEGVKCTQLKTTSSKVKCLDSNFNSSQAYPSYKEFVRTIWANTCKSLKQCQQLSSTLALLLLSAFMNFAISHHVYKFLNTYQIAIFGDLMASLFLRVITGIFCFEFFLCNIFLMCIYFLKDIQPRAQKGNKGETSGETNIPCS